MLKHSGPLTLRHSPQSVQPRPRPDSLRSCLAPPPLISRLFRPLPFLPTDSAVWKDGSGVWRAVADKCAAPPRPAPRPRPRGPTPRRPAPFPALHPSLIPPVPAQVPAPPRPPLRGPRRQGGPPRVPVPRLELQRRRLVPQHPAGAPRRPRRHPEPPLVRPVIHDPGVPGCADPGRRPPAHPPALAPARHLPRHPPRVSWCRLAALWAWSGSGRRVS